MRFLQATEIFDGKEFLPAGQVIVLDDKNNFVETIAESQVERSNILKAEGIITPGFVNAHCHLELSHLKGKIDQHTGLVGFAKQIITQRDKISKGEKREHMQDADAAMIAAGIMAVGDISNEDISFEIKAESKIHYHSFIELIALKPEAAESVFTKGMDVFNRLNEYDLHGSFAAHAPYSCSLELISGISEFDAIQGSTFCIHNQESEEEQKFFFGKENDFTELYKFLNLDISWFKAPLRSSLQHYAEVLKANKNILVHNTFTSETDINAVRNKNVFWCFCPAANKYIENTEPQYDLFSYCKHAICLGTDSLASNTSLTLMNEANLILNKSSVFSLEDTLRFMCNNGAQALNLEEEFGNFLPGKNAGLNLLTFSNNSLTFVKKLI